jgi:hypothetical protein
MSMHEALKSLRGAIPWLRHRDNEDQPAAPIPPTPLELAESLVLLAKAQGLIDRTSPTWSAVSRWVAQELIRVQAGLETASGDKAAALRSRAKTLRDVLAMGDPEEMKPMVEDMGPYVP